MLLRLFQPPSYRVVPLADARAAATALGAPTISVVELERSSAEHGHDWQASVDAWKATEKEYEDSRLQISLGSAASSGPDVEELLERHFGFAPEATRHDMLRLLRLFATCAAEQGGATPDTPLNVRLLLSNGVRGACSQLHYDNVALRLSCCYLGAGTRHLPEAAVNRAAFIALQRRSRLPVLLQRALIAPWGWSLYNALVRLPWGSERSAPEGGALLMKGSRWRRSPPRALPLPPHVAGPARPRRAGPALHRSPLVLAGDEGVEATVESGRRALFTVDYV